jgi:hypothetical protein
VLEQLERLSKAGVKLSAAPNAAIYVLAFGGEVASDGSCLFEAVRKARTRSRSQSLLLNLCMHVPRTNPHSLHVPVHACLATHQCT